MIDSKSGNAAEFSATPLPIDCKLQSVGRLGRQEAEFDDVGSEGATVAMGEASRTGRRGRIVRLATIGAILTALCVARTATAEVTAEQVRRSIADGVAYLKSQQNKVDGSWGEAVGQPGGLSSLVMLALLSAGEDPRGETLQRGLKYLEELGNPQMTYATSLQTMVFCAADPAKYQARILENARWLERIQVGSGPRKGMWAYSASQGGGDNSNTQFALLALYEAERAGVKIDPQVWRSSVDYWSRTQKNDGSWGYTAGEPSTGSMTCAGIASLVIASGRLGFSDASVTADGVRCCGGADEDDEVAARIERGLEWLGRHFQADANPSGEGIGGPIGRSWLFYYLYGVERVGRLTGRRYVVGPRRVDGRGATAPHDWYREGAEFLVREQDKLQRFWKGSGIAETNPTVATSLALLFLSKGRRPIVLAKARHGDSDDWDVHRQGVPHLTRRLEQTWKRDLGWQTVDLAASVEDLLQSPVIFLSGRRSLELDPTRKENLKQYVAQGGFLFVEACDGAGCDGKEFDASFRALLAELFPQSKLRLLPPDHPVWFAEQRVDPDHLRPLFGLDTCCRTSVVYCPQTLSCYWDVYPFERADERPEASRASIEAAMRIGLNVVTYATNRELKDKLDRPAVAVRSGDRTAERGLLIVPKLTHAGGADEASNALANLLQTTARETELSVDLKTRLMSPGDPALVDHPIAFIHGRRSFRWTPAERQALATYLRRGGTLIGDSICASGPFADAFRQEVQAALPGARFERIPVRDPIFTNRYGGFDLAKVKLRDPQARSDGDPLLARLIETPPLLEAIELDGRYAVVFSPYDLSCALENHASLDCKGYVTADAARIGVNVLLYALQQ